jgi:hypothetical protein
MIINKFAILIFDILKIINKTANLFIIIEKKLKTT